MKKFALSVMPERQTRCALALVVLFLGAPILRAYDQEQVSTLLRMIAVEWNTWRTRNPSVVVRLDGANLASKDLDNRNLSGAGLRLANLRGANLTGSNLSGANLNRAKLQAARMSGVRLSSASVENAHLEGANISNAKLIGVKLTKSNLNGCLMSFTDMTTANLRQVQMQNANLEKAVLRRVSAPDINFDGADFKNAILHMGVFTDAHGTGAKFVGAMLTGAKFQRAYLKQADFRGAQLSLVDFTGAQLLSANFTDTILFPVRVAGSMSQAQVDQMRARIANAGDGSFFVRAYSCSRHQALSLCGSMNSAEELRLKFILAEADASLIDRTNGVRLAGANLTGAIIHPAFRSAIQSAGVTGFNAIAWQGASRIPKRDKRINPHKTKFKRKKPF